MEVALGILLEKGKIEVGCWGLWVCPTAQRHSESMVQVRFREKRSQVPSLELMLGSPILPNFPSSQCRRVTDSVWSFGSRRPPQVKGTFVPLPQGKPLLSHYLLGSVPAVLLRRGISFKGECPQEKEWGGRAIRTSSSR